ncbi:hypothetical protein C8J57DRAFT_1517904 [Mycena rebaudengoi]|nr:hypothetical protein C8J57DRAFT_1517904 [Mycena rebaudengoi]
MCNRIRLLSRDYARVVDQNPAFWTALLITPRTPIDFLLLFLERVGNQPFHFTIRAFRPTEYDPSSNSGNYDSAEEFLIDAIGMFEASMGRCLSLAIEVQDVEVLAVVLANFEHCDSDILEAFSMRFGTTTYADFDNPISTEFSFLGWPAYGETVEEFNTLVISRCHSDYPSISRVAGLRHILRIYQPSSLLMDWETVMTVVTSSSTVQTVVLDGLLVDASVYSPLVMSPLTSITTLDLTFCTSRSMAQLLAVMRFPSIRALKVTLDCCEDLELLKTCTGILRRVSELTIRSQCDRDQGIPEFFGLLPNVSHLDLTKADEVFFTGLRVACLMDGSGVDNSGRTARGYPAFSSITGAVWTPGFGIHTGTFAF